MATPVLLPQPPPFTPGVHREEYRDQAKQYVLAARSQGVTWREIHEELAGSWSLIRLKQWAKEARDGVPVRGYGQPLPPADGITAQADSLPNSTVVGTFGPRGSGKTLTAAWLMREYWVVGRPVIYNPAGLLRFPQVPGRSCTFLSLKDIALMAPQMTGAVVLLDELQVNLSKWRATTSASALIRRVVQQTRKIGMDLIVTSNSPQEIDYSFANQLNMHGHCKAYLPPDYPGQDDVFVQWTDTHRRYGKGRSRSARGHHIDDRIRVAERLWPASEMFPWFDTTITVDPLEVMGLTPDELRQAQEESDAGIKVAELAVFCRNRLIPDLVRDGKASIVPGNIVLWAEKVYRHGFDHSECCGATVRTEEGLRGCKKGAQVPLRVSPEMMGAALRRAGLLPRRVGQGQKYPLPPPERLADWQNGMWAIGDDD